MSNSAENLKDVVLEWLSCSDVSLKDIFDNEEIRRRVRDEFDIEEIFDADDMIKYITSSYSPDGVFYISELEHWALENGFVREK